jgi:general secretion pathway protein N
VKTLAYALIFLVALAGAALAFAPASLLDAQLSVATSGQLRLAMARGTLWRGKATLTDAASTFALPLALTLEPLPLARGELALQLVPPAETAEPRGRASLSRNRVQLEALAATVPAALLPMLLPWRPAPALGGDVHLDVPVFDASASAWAGDAAVRWTGASVALGGVRPIALGELAIAFKPRGNELAGALTNSGGELALNGTVLIGPQRTSVDLTLDPRPNASAAIAQFLTTLGRGDPQGTVRVSWQGAPLVPAASR